MKNLFLLIVLSILIVPCFSQDKHDKLLITEPMPSFPGGEEALNKYIQDNLVYPQSALDNNIKGKVVVQFAIAPNGDIVNIRIKESLYTPCDSVVLDLIKKMPKWKPVRKDSISDDFTLPIIFRLPYDIIDGEKTYTIPDKLPQFPGGEKDMFKFIAANLKWPPEYAEVDIQGRVTIRFVVTKEGKIMKPEILRGIEPMYFDKEAIRIVSIMPDWIPAKYKGENVNAYFTIPIVFRLLH